MTLLAVILGAFVMLVVIAIYGYVQRLRSPRVDVPVHMLSQDLYSHYRSPSPAELPARLQDCPEVDQERWRMVARYVQRGWFAAGLILVLISSCAAPQHRRAAMDFAACSTEHVLVPSMAGLGAQLERRADWQDWGLKALTGALSGAAVCGLRQLATTSRADGPAPAGEDWVRIRRLAARCGPAPGAGQCEGAEERAAWLLWRASGYPWPPSGEG